ncbi:MAG: hypothetical protein DMD25_09255 [Gemmatimonadetes bacterium]|nr:MAG: hypothetical protein DMD27_10090 [Gemmatimonadota bacterium]PYP77140.1 MAG: hypothetical protein DMD25_09255 [Gemmatimonadota bacterium]
MRAAIVLAIWAIFPLSYETPGSPKKSPGMVIGTVKSGSFASAMTSSNLASAKSRTSVRVENVRARTTAGSLTSVV